MKSVTVNNTEYKTSTELAQAVSYSADYISRLAREGKVRATRVGRQWFIDPISFNSFLEQTEIQKKAYSEKLRADRKQERKRVGSVQEQIESPYTHTQAISSPYQVVSALLFSFMVVFCGAVFGYVISPTDSVPAMQVGGAGFARESLKSDPVVSDMNMAELKNTRADGQGIVVFDATTPEKTVEQVRSAFSDEVVVEFENDDSGVVTPVFRERLGDSYKFLMVPVQSAS